MNVSPTALTSRLSSLKARSSRWLAVRRPDLFGRYSRPDSIALLLTERCSARCVHCDIWRNRGVERGPGESDWTRVVDDLRDWLGPAHVVFTGGEALLKPFTIDLVRHASSIGLRVEVLTHGYWRDQGLIESLARARPWRVTVSLDGLGAYHDYTRGRDGFFERTAASLATLATLRKQVGAPDNLRLKTVIMRHNLTALGDVASYAASLGADVLYQPIEQNYNTPENPEWMQASDNWPDDIDAALAAVGELIKLKADGLPIANSVQDFERMASYFQDPDRYRVRTQNHDPSATCAALSSLQINANGDIKACIGSPPIGNITEGRVRDCWSARRAVWNGNCCLGARMSPAELADLPKLARR